MSKRKLMQVVIEEIVTNAWLLAEFEAAINQRHEFCLRVENAPFMPLVIEVTAAGEIAVAHTYLQEGDVMRDPEIVFLPGLWLAVEITQDPVGIFQRAKDGHYLAGAQSLANVWAKNLREQGFTGSDVTFVVCH